MSKRSAGPRRMSTLLPAVVMMLSACGSAPDVVEAEVVEIGIPVTAAIAEVRDIEEILETTAVATARYDAMLTAETTVKVLRRRFEVGDSVQAGVALLQVDDKILRAQREQAAAQVQQATDALALREFEKNTAQELHSQGRISDHDLLAAKLGSSSAGADLSAAKAGLTQIDEALRQASMPAPFSGNLSSWHVDKGDRTMPGMPVARVVQLDPIVFEFGATEGQHHRLREGQPTRVRVRGQDELLEGEVTMVAPAASAQARTWSVEVSTPNADHKLSPGTIAELSIITDNLETQVTVPWAAVAREDVTVVYVLDGDIARRRPVLVGQVFGDLVAISEGLQAGEEVVVGGRAALSDGVRVRVKEPRVEKQR